MGDRRGQRGSRWGLSRLGELRWHARRLGESRQSLLALECPHPSSQSQIRTEMEVAWSDPDRKALPEGQPGSHPPGRGQKGGCAARWPAAGRGPLPPSLRCRQSSLTLEQWQGRVLFNQLIDGHCCLCPLYWLPESGGLCPGLMYKLSGSLRSAWRPSPPPDLTKTSS